MSKLRFPSEGSTRIAELALVAVIFFGLGALAMERFASGPAAVAIVEPPAPPPAPQEFLRATSLAMPESGYVASRYGKTYYLASCANTIKPENKIYFKAKEDAEKAGLVPAKSCFR